MQYIFKESKKIDDKTWIGCFEGKTVKGVKMALHLTNK